MHLSCDMAILNNISISLERLHGQAGLIGPLPLLASLVGEELHAVNAFDVFGNRYRRVRHTDYVRFSWVAKMRQISAKRQVMIIVFQLSVRCTQL
jgi:hypothetical protein